MNQLSINPADYDYTLNADDMFALSSSIGLPLWAILEESIKRGLSHFPWYGYARRKWHSGANKETILCEIREALSLNTDWPESHSDILGHLQNLWPELEIS